MRHMRMIPVEGDQSERAESKRLNDLVTLPRLGGELRVCSDQILSY